MTPQERIAQLEEMLRNAERDRNGFPNLGMVELFKRAPYLARELIEAMERIERAKEAMRGENCHYPDECHPSKNWQCSYCKAFSILEGAADE